MINAFVSLGSNLGNKKENIEKAIKKIGSIKNAKIEEISSLIETKPHQAPGPNYLNGVIKIITNLSAENLLDCLKKIETELGRKRSFKNAPRTIDLDILLYGNKKIKTKKLIVPHPKLKIRDFFKKSLLEIEPNLKLV
ncbi:MAG: 2-amino-4-hydroxy-6-hydroxymethyldihydropteridine diphosphokinase [Candidatus Omnitrophica bacterium]|nr:2-amino-4-hydroxy-6-hydroxymethyldihydropteridine diphosphokinase [Candidatus Omnitrophota bacterium]MCF7895029.1 2-amino-4-hydroxy-6-hydroxymethyldihydropteridine diphosphokinase [Candidatus Omnitrophota bacterium]